MREVFSETGRPDLYVHESGWTLSSPEGKRLEKFSKRPLFGARPANRAATTFVPADSRLRSPFGPAPENAPRLDAESLLDLTFLEGTSPIDLSRLAITDRTQAYEFVSDYGYDLCDERDRTEVHLVLQEAVAFMRRHLCPAPREGDVALTLPDAIEWPADPTDLLLWASSDPQEEPLQPWACAALRVMHAISHANHTLRSRFHLEIRRQILGRYRQHLHHDQSGQVFLGQGPDAVALVQISFREEKSRDSLILKLLHKPDNQPQSVYDRVGVKMITFTKADALRVLKYLRKRHLANFAHLTPGRSRNTLIDLKPSHNSGVQAPRSSDEEVTELVFNPHSSAEFRSIQFTCQQLIKVQNPAHNLAQKIRQELRSHASPELEAALTEIRGYIQEPQLRFFFPYEVQILDLENHRKTESGPSSHANYRLRQLRAARLRVLGRLLRTPSCPAEE